MLPLRGKYIFPNTVIHFDVSRSRSVKAIEESMEHDQLIFLNNQIDPMVEDPGIDDLYRVGTLARIKQVVKLPKNTLRVFAEGLFRAELSKTVEYDPLFKVEILYDHVEQQPFEAFEREAFLRMIKEAFESYAQAWPHLDQNIINYILLQSDVEILVDELATHIPFSYPEKQKILEEMDLKERCELMLVMLEEELDVLKLKQKIQPVKPWIIHGFRGKAALAEEYLRHGFYLSFGEKYQEEALCIMPSERLFIETDESTVSVDTLYERAAILRKTPLEELRRTIRKNVSEIFFRQ